MDIQVGRIIEELGARELCAPANPDAHIVGLVWDSRQVLKGYAYAAIVGERVDGHDFIDAALDAGAGLVLASHQVPEDVLGHAKRNGAAVVLVQDVTEAVGCIAGLWRGMLNATVIGVTGSVGKTTTKGLIRDILSTKYRTVATKGNFNNELGAPFTVLSASADTQMLVVEMGMDGAGQIAALAAMARPSLGIVTIVGTSHLEYLKTRQNIALAKAELFDALPEGGRAFLNAGCDMSAFMAQSSKLADRGVSTCAFSAQGEPRASLGAWAQGDAVWAEDVSVDAEGHPAFTLCVRGLCGAEVLRAPVKLALRGAQNVSNACGAVGVCLACGMTFDEVVSALGQAQPEAGRAQLLKAACGAVVFNDAYNAAPESMCAALETLAAYACEGRRIAVLGDMGELGSSSEEGHARCGRAAAECGVDMLVCVGEQSLAMAAAAKQVGFDESRITCVADAPAALKLMQETVAQGDAVLVKASHYMGLDSVVEGIVAC